MTKEVNLESVTVGDTQAYNFSFETQLGVAKDITDWTIYFTVKESSTDPDGEAIISKDVTSHDKPTDGETSVTLEPSDTKVEPGAYVYDVQIKRDTGTVTTLMTGMIEFTRGVTERDD
jgi:hypothetical protein